MKVVLLQERKTLARGDDDIAVGGLQFTGKNLQEGRLSGTVGSDEAIAVALGEFDIYILETGLFYRFEASRYLH